jgi:leucyl aminopeptidase
MVKTTKKAKKTDGHKAERRKETPLFGIAKKGWLDGAQVTKSGDLQVLVNAGHIFFFGAEDPDGEITEQIGELCDLWQLNAIKNKKDVSHVQSEIGPIWIVKGHVASKAQDHYGLLDESSYGRARDLVGSILPRAKEYDLKDLRLGFFDASPEQKLGALVGLEVGAYTYKNVRYGKGTLPQLHLDKSDSKVITEAAALGLGINIARHLVNIPGKELNPKSYSEFI